MVGGVRDGRGHQETYPWQPRAASSGDRETRSENNERVYIMYCTQQVHFDIFHGSCCCYFFNFLILFFLAHGACATKVITLVLLTVGWSGIHTTY